MDIDLIKGIYSDFFENPLPEPGNAGKNTDKPGTKDGGKNKGQTGTQGGKGGGKGSLSTEDALKNAKDAIDEAKALFDNPPVLTPATAVSSGQTEAQAAEKQEPEEDPEEQLDELIGLKDIKHDVRELADFAKVQKMRKEQGMKSVPVSLHLVFTGNPGTGKTTVARILGRMYKKIGILSNGQLVEVDRSGLVAGYVGQTALKTQKVIQSAMGGVLFIDEAYALSQENDAFGQEAIDTLLKAMEDHRDNLIVIIAGYTEPMEVFINSNPGLKSRFNKYIEFPDYTMDELEQIFYLNCNKYEYVVDEDAKEPIRQQILLRRVKNLVNFANGREMRNMFEEIITNQARRIAAMENPSAEDLKRITLDDLRDETLEKTDGKDAGTPAEENTESAGQKEKAGLNETAGPEETAVPEESAGSEEMTGTEKAPGQEADELKESEGTEETEEVQETVSEEPEDASETEKTDSGDQ